MKKFTSITLSLVVIAFAGAFVKADDLTITITKAGDTTAKVCQVPAGKCSPGMVPIKFDDGADWSMVKDTYTVSPETASALMMKKETISIGTDGTATFHSKKMMKK